MHCCSGAPGCCMEPALVLQLQLKEPVREVGPQALPSSMSKL